MERKWTQQDKLQLILMMIKQPKKQRELLGKHGVGKATYFKWKNRFIQGGLSELNEYERGPKKLISSEHEQELLKKLAEAHDRINYMATELMVIKKKSNSRIGE
jgi:transposase